MRTSPDYLAYTVPCPLNAVKLAQVEAFVKALFALIVDMEVMSSPT